MKSCSWTTVHSMLPTSPMTSRSSLPSCQVKSPRLCLFDDQCPLIFPVMSSVFSSCFQFLQHVISEVDVWTHGPHMVTDLAFTSKHKRVWRLPGTFWQTKPNSNSAVICPQLHMEPGGFRASNYLHSYFLNRGGARLHSSPEHHCHRHCNSHSCPHPHIWLLF